MSAPKIKEPDFSLFRKDITDVQEKLLNERVVGFVKKDETSMDELSDRISKLIKALSSKESQFFK